MTAPLLSVSDASISYGKVEAVRSVSLDVGRNEIVTIVGANGAGKTTLLNAIMGILPQSGRIRFDGIDIAGIEIEDRVAAGLSLVPEHRELFGTMSVEDNLQLGAFRNARAAAQSFERVYALFPRLAERRRQAAGTLSGGERQMLALGRALMSEPKLLMLDEPSLGLAPAVVETLYETLQRLHEGGLTLLLAEQSIPLALSISDYAYVLQTGRIALEGRASELETNEQVREIYLGINSRAAKAALQQ
jgi:branched-chain amino acid transport system ATP-binding protein